MHFCHRRYSPNLSFLRASHRLIICLSDRHPQEKKDHKSKKDGISKSPDILFLQKEHGRTNPSEIIRHCHGEHKPQEAEYDSYLVAERGCGRVRWDVDGAVGGGHRGRGRRSEEGLGWVGFGKVSE